MKIKCIRCGKIQSEQSALERVRDGKTVCNCGCDDFEAVTESKDRIQQADRMDL